MGGAVRFSDLGERKIAVDGKKPCQGSEAIAFTSKDGGCVEAGRGDHSRECSEKGREIKGVQSLRRVGMFSVREKQGQCREFSETG